MPHTPGRTIHVLFSCLVLVLLSAAAGAATLQGIVRDSSGRVIAGARVTLISPNRVMETTSSSAGRFVFESPTAPVTVRVTKNGFAESEATWSGAGDLEFVLNPAVMSEQVVVTATRSEAALSDVASAVTALGTKELTIQPALQADAVLRQVPGFSLFRRTDSRTAHPTAQGVSLRGLGASGASRALVLFDGIPLNDPFGGWVYWDRVPSGEISSVEVFRGGGSALYGSGALAGVINFRRDLAAQPVLTMDLSAGGQGTRTGSLGLSVRPGQWHFSASAKGMMTDGYIPVAADARGPVDAPANVRYGNSWFRAGRKVKGGSLFLAGDLFNESRQNGTLLQTNNTRLGEGSAGGDLDAAGGNLSLRFYASAQRYKQTFSSISLDRTTEVLVRTQAVPAQQVGASAQWIRPLSARNVLAMGVDVRQIRGRTDEIVLLQSAPTTRVLAGGHQFIGGGFVEDMLQAGRLSLTMAARIDSWRNYDAFSKSLPLSSTGTYEDRALLDRSSAAFSPSVGAVVRVTNMVSISGSAYGAFRSPTLNELYRGFRQGNVETLANESLSAERLRGAEGAINITSGPVFLRAGYFWNTIHDAVGNRTQQVTPQLITRQRLNIGSLDAQGVEVEMRASLPLRLWIRSSYAYSDARVGRTLETRLAGLRIPQVPRHAVSTSIAYLGSRWNATVVGRYTDRQYDDDLNQLSLPGNFAADAFLSYRPISGVEAYIACENLMDRSYVVSRTPVEGLGSGTLARVGVKFRWPFGQR